MGDVKLGTVILDARSIQQLFRLDGIDFTNMNYDQLTGVIRQVTNQHSDAELTHYLQGDPKSTGGPSNQVFFQID